MASRNTALATRGRVSPAALQTAREVVSFQQRLAQARSKAKELQAAAESRGMHLLRGAATVGGGFAAGLVSLETPDKERMIGPVPLPVALGAAAMLGAMAVPGDSIASHTLASAGAGALAGWAYTEGRSAAIAWMGDIDSDVNDD